jgi:hypothetical protein
MNSARTRLLWSLVAALIVLPPFLGCEVQQADVDAARQRAAEERRDVGEAVRDNAREVGDSVRDAREDVTEEAREAAEAQKEADRLELELELKKERDTYLASARTRLAEVDSLLERRRTALSGMEEAAQTQEDARLDALDEQRNALDKAIDNAESAAIKDWRQYKPAVEQALQRLKDADQA